MWKRTPNRFWIVAWGGIAKTGASKNEVKSLKRGSGGLPEGGLPISKKKDTLGVWGNSRVTLIALLRSPKSPNIRKKKGSSRRWEKGGDGKLPQKIFFSPYWRIAGQQKGTVPQGKGCRPDQKERRRCTSVPNGEKKDQGEALPARREGCCVPPKGENMNEGSGGRAQCDRGRHGDNQNGWRSGHHRRWQRMPC